MLSTLRTSINATVGFLPAQAALAYRHRLPSPGRTGWQAEVSTPAAILPPRTEEGLGKALLQGGQVAGGNRPHTPP